MEHLPIIYHPDKIQPSESRLYFFDANIWLQLLNPYTVKPTLAPYVKLWKQMQQEFTGEPMVVANAVVLSEVFNRYLRIRFDVWKRQEGVVEGLKASGFLLPGSLVDYKTHYRPSKAHQDSIDLLLAEWQDVAHYVTFKETEVESQILPKMLSSYRVESDFNDAYYTEFCKAHGLCFVTHDGDFYTGGMEMITANWKTLNKYEEMQRKLRR